MNEDDGDRRQCWDTAHPDDCQCGADPDAVFEAGRERRAER